MPSFSVVRLSVCAPWRTNCQPPSDASIVVLQFCAWRFREFSGIWKPRSGSFIRKPTASTAAKQLSGGAFPAIDGAPTIRC